MSEESFDFDAAEDPYEKVIFIALSERMASLGQTSAMLQLNRTDTLNMSIGLTNTIVRAMANGPIVIRYSPSGKLPFIITPLVTPKKLGFWGRIKKIFK